MTGSKTGIVVIARDELPGDALMAQPAIEKLSTDHDIVFLAMHNEKVLEILDLPENVFNLMGNEPCFRRLDLPVQMLGVFASIGYEYKFPLNAHPTETLMILAGCGRPDSIPRPKIKQTDWCTPNFDVVIAPWSRGEVKAMQGHQVLELAKTLKEEGLTTVLLGGEFDLRPNTIPCAYGRNYLYGANLMQNAKCVVTVDSFPGRLAHAAGIKNHIILNSNVVPWIWQSHPDATEVKAITPGGKPPVWDIQQIVSTIGEKLSVTA